MSRIGFIPCEESLDTVEKISKLPGLEVEGIFTHFARADEKTIEPAREPFRKYMAFVEELEKRGVKIPIHHVSNSASIIGFSEANLDMVRSGITTYGLYPSNEVAKDVLILEPAMQWKSIISYIKTVEPGFFFYNMYLVFFFNPVIPLRIDLVNQLTSSTHNNSSINQNMCMGWF